MSRKLDVLRRMTVWERPAYLYYTILRKKKAAGSAGEHEDMTKNGVHDRQSS